jgi:prevent-host-death family protein
VAYATTEAKTELDAVINKVRRSKQRVALTRRGKLVAAVVSIEDLEYLEAIEAEENAEDIKACKAALKDKKSDLIPWEKVKKELGYV